MSETERPTDDVKHMPLWLWRCFVIAITTTAAVTVYYGVVV